MTRTARLIAGVAVAAIAGYLGVSAAGTLISASAAQLAATDAAAVIKERQALMKSNGKDAKAIAQFVESGEGTAEDVAKNAAAIEANAGKIVALFPEGTSLDDGVGKTGAKPEIWQDMAGFKAAAARLGDLADALEQAAQGGDKQEIAAAFATLGKNGCGGCHTKFRKKLD